MSLFASLTLPGGSKGTYTQDVQIPNERPTLSSTPQNPGANGPHTDPPSLSHTHSSVFSVALKSLLRSNQDEFCHNI